MVDVQQHQFAFLSRLDVGRIKASLEDEQLLSAAELEKLDEKGKGTDRSDVLYLLDVLKRKDSFHLYRFLRILGEKGYDNLVFKVESTDSTRSDERTRASLSEFLDKARKRAEDKVKVDKLIVRSGKLQQIRNVIGTLSAFPCANRKVVLQGPAGFGKTVLIAQAVSCAWLKEEYFRDGIIWKTVHREDYRKDITEDITEDIMRSIVRLAEKTDVEVHALSGQPLRLAALSVAMRRKLLVVVDGVEKDSFLSAFKAIPIIMLFSTRNKSFGKQLKEGILRVDVSECTDDEAKEIIMKCSNLPSIPELALRIAIAECDGIPRRLAKLGESLGRNPTIEGVLRRDPQRVITELLKPIKEQERAEEREEAFLSIFMGLIREHESTIRQHIPTEEEEEDVKKHLLVECHRIPHSAESLYPLHYAAATGFVPMLERYVGERSHSNYSGKDDGGRTPLHWAAYNGHVEMVQLLLKSIAKEDVDAVDSDGRTPLHYASAKGHIEIMVALVEAGADVNAKDQSNKNPID